ncbi:hypothetical protein FHE25_10645 [Salmonella enterica]|nr:hypothetical protein [Salmonella enterica]EAV1936978.1 hypothetical protein [Salmonella enterica]EBB7502267.1 hypothetical protein [Salmonella enterica]HAF2302971.1 hypothetical protein [Salmonella enterica]
MNHIQFIEKNVREALIKQGFPESVAQGGRGRQSTFTSECHRRARKEGYLMMFYDTQKHGLKNRRRKRK